MKTRIILSFICIASLTSMTFGQETSPQLKKKINEAFTKMQHYERTTPAWKKYVDAQMSGGSYYMKEKEWSNAIKCYNNALKIVPNYLEAIRNRNYCRLQLKTSKKK